MVDTVTIARKRFPGQQVNLDALVKKLKINSKRYIPIFKRTYQGWNIRGDPIIEKSQDQDQGQGQGQDHLLPQRAALPPFLVLALTLTLVLALGSEHHYFF